MPAEASKSGKFLFAGRRDGARGLTGGVASIGLGRPRSTGAAEAAPRKKSVGACITRQRADATAPLRVETTRRK